MELEFHHINYVAEDVDRLHDFYVKVLGLKISHLISFWSLREMKRILDMMEKLASMDGKIQMHLAEKDTSVAKRNGQKINPVERGHIAFRTKDIRAFKQILDDKGIAYSDYGTAFAEEWHQVFFCDPEGNIVEVHQKV